MKSKYHYLKQLLIFSLLFFSCSSGREITLKSYDFGYEFILFENDFYFHVDLIYLKEYFEKNSFNEMSYFTDSLITNKVKYIDVSLLYNDLQKNTFLISEYEILIILSLQKNKIIIFDEEKNKINKIRVKRSSDYKYKYRSYYFGDIIIIKSSSNKYPKRNIY